MSPRAWSPATSGTWIADFSICVPGSVKLPNFSTTCAMFSLMTSVSRVRRTCAAIPVPPTSSDGMSIRFPSSYTYG